MVIDCWLRVAATRPLRSTSTRWLSATISSRSDELMTTAQPAKNHGVVWTTGARTRRAA